MPKIKSSYALVDWYNVQSFIDPDLNRNPRLKIPNALLQVQQEVARVLGRVDATSRHRVILRVYNGWHENREPMPIRRDFEMFEHDTSLARRFNNVSFVPGLQFGNNLLANEGIYPLYGTYRGGSQAAQKMVDSAIVCDLLHLVRENRETLCVVVSDDDDFIPAMVTVKAWNGRMILLRRPDRSVGNVTDEDCESELAFWGEA